MWSELENFFETHQHTVAAAEAFGTVSAVVVSLFLATLVRRAHRTRVKAVLSMSVIQHSSLKGKERPRYLTVTIANDGMLPASIPFSYFRWRVPFSRTDWFIVPRDYTAHDPWVPVRKYPFVIAPRRSETFFAADTGELQSLLRKIANETKPGWRFRFLRARVLTEDGISFRAKIDRSVRKELLAIRSEKARGGA